MFDVLKTENVVDRMKISTKDEFECESCIMGKQTLSKNNKSSPKTTSEILELVYTDLAGPIEPTAKDGFRYSISFTDDYSGLIFVYFLKQKNDAVKAVERFLADVK